MQLKPLEFCDALSDSPFFRQTLYSHEIALEESSKKIKDIEQFCRKIMSQAQKLSQAEKQLSTALSEFKMDFIGGISEDDRMMANYVKDLGTLINNIEEHRLKTIDRVEIYLSPLQSLVERINRVRSTEKQKYSKESGKFYQTLEKNLNLKVSAVRSKNDFKEADAQLSLQQRTFCLSSLNYVSEIQSVQECVRFEFVQMISSFLYQWFLFYLHANEIQNDYGVAYSEMLRKVEKAKESYEVQQGETDELKRKILSSHMRNSIFSSDMADNGPQACNSELNNAPNPSIKQGYLFMLEKSLLSKAISQSRSSLWNKYYCVYSKESRIFSWLPVNNIVKRDVKGDWIGQANSFKLKHCSRRSTDSIDKRFCFDVIAEEKNEAVTLQALSSLDLLQWLEAMGGHKQDVVPSQYANIGARHSSHETELDEVGFEFVRHCIAIIESKGIKEQGIYRNCGVNSKVQKLMQLALDKRTGDRMLSDEEWDETRTVSSAVKAYLRNLNEPLLTYNLHTNFINSSKITDPQLRIKHIHWWIYQLPEQNRRMLEIIIRHLRNVANFSADNLMSVANLAVCFGPTLLRPREETVAAVLDIKFCNVVVEVLIENYHMIFETQPQNILFGPPKPINNYFAPVQSNSDSSDAEICATPSQMEHRLKLTPALLTSLEAWTPKFEALTPPTSTFHLQSPTIPRQNKSTIISEQKQGTSTIQTESYNPDSSNEEYPSMSEADVSLYDAPIHLMHRIPPSYSNLINPDMSFLTPRRVRTLFPCSAGHETELNFEANQIITNVYPSKEDGWLVGTLNGRTGLIPSNYNILQCCADICNFSLVSSSHYNPLESKSKGFLHHHRFAFW